MKKILLLALLFFILPGIVLAQAAGDNCIDSGPSTGLCNAIDWGGADDIPSFIQALMAWIGTVIGTLALVMIIASGARMIVSQGDPAAVGQAKTALTYSVLGLVLSMFSFIIVVAVQNFIGASEVPGGASGGLFNPLGTNNAKDFVIRLVRNFLGLLGTLTVLMLILNGFRYMAARGNEDATKKAKAAITWAIIGLISVLLSYVIIVAVTNSLRNA